MTRSKESNLTKAKKSNLAKAKQSDFTKTCSFGIDFLTLKVKKAFTYLQIAFVKVSILYHFHLKNYLCIKIDALKYIINGVISQMTSDQLSSNHITHKNPSPNFSKSEIN